MRARHIVLSAVVVAGCSVDRSGYTYALPPVADADRTEDAATDTLLLDSSSHDVTAPSDAGREPDAGEADAFESGIPDVIAPDVRIADALPDTPTDAGPMDTGPEDADVPDTDIEADTGIDAALLDASGEDGSVDAEPDTADAPDTSTEDASLPDSGPDEDAGSEDAGSDAGLEEGGQPDAGPREGCADDSVEQRYPADPDAGLVDMVGCDGALDQCTAEMLCGVGWHLCTPAEYEARGGNAAPATAIRWLAGCMRLGNCTSTGGISDVCGDCSAESGPLAVFGNACTGGTRVETAVCPAGVIASSMGIRFRLDGDPDCLHAEIAGTDAAYGATCCR